MWQRRWFSQGFRANFSRESQLMKLSEVSRTVAHLRVNRASPTVITAALQTATREFCLLDQRIRTKDGMNSCRYLLNEIRLLGYNDPVLLKTIAPAVHNCVPDVKVLSFCYFTLRKAQCDSEEFFLWAEEQLLAETAHATVGKLKDLVQVLSGISCTRGSLSVLQKQILKNIDKTLCIHPQCLNSEENYCSALHSFAKAGTFSSNLKQLLETRLPPMLAQVARHPEKRLLGVIISSACRMKLDTQLLCNAVFPILLQNLNTLSPKHLISVLFYTAEPGLYDSALHEKVRGTLPYDLRNQHLSDMLKDAKHRADQLSR